jgi:hypothetical protein
MRSTLALALILLVLATSSAASQEQAPELPNVTWTHVYLGFGTTLASSAALAKITDNDAIAIIAPIAVVAIGGGFIETAECGGQCAHRRDFTSYLIGAVPGALAGHFLSRWILGP